MACFPLIVIWYFRIESKESKEDAKPIDNSKEAAIEAEVQAARQRAVVPLEIRMKQFRDMLAEKDVSRLRLKPVHSFNKSDVYI